MDFILRRINTLTFVKTTLVIFFLCIVSLSISCILNNQMVIVSSAIMVISLLIFIIGMVGLMSYSKQIKQMSVIAKHSADGSLYHRITNIDSTEEIGLLAWNINNMLDQFESFSRDMDTSLKMVSQGKTYRRMLPVGLHGDFVRLSNNINKALETIAVAQSKDEFIQQMLSTLDEYKSGIYTSKIDLSGMQEDIIMLAKGINELGDALSKLSQINLKNGLALKQDSDVLAENVKKLSDSSKHQAASLEETSAALEEITANMRQSSQNTSAMSEYANEVTTSVHEGEVLANKTATSMDAINEQTKSITEAITVIDQIAFQTNILSLNAAVEAATAGEAGKGFAVVAGEVRNLASRSAEAAKEIKDIVEKATVKANEGKQIADDMIEGYSKLNTNIASTIELINEVATATKEQEQGIVQINDAIATLDKQTQQSASIAHETNIVAQQSHDIADQIVKEANKEFEGKENIRLRKKIIDPNYKGPERRSIERRIKNNEF